MDDDLLPCPCCGSRPAYCEAPEDGDNAGAFYIECTNEHCQLTTPLVFASGEDPQPHLSSKWNNRAGEMKRLYDGIKAIAELRYSDAGEPFDEALDIADALLTPNAGVQRRAERTSAATTG